MSHTDRVVVLVDMDCFYCQVEEKLDASLTGKPIAVVQYNAWRGGGLIAVNYPARDKGVTRHMRGDEAKEKCPDIELVRVPTVRGKADLTKYREAGKRVAEVLKRFTSLLQRASIDEAYLDITESVNNRIKNLSKKITAEDLKQTYVVGCETGDFISNIYNNEFYNEHNLKLLVGALIVEEIRAAVCNETGYECSAGIAHNKILAKLACGMNKPNKQTVLPHDNVAEMYKTLPVHKIKSLGGKFGNTLSEELNIKYMSELAKFSEKELLKRFDDKTAIWLYNIARGVDNEPVEQRLVSKSIGCCKRFPGKSALLTVEDVTHWLSELAEELSERLVSDLEENNRKAKQVVVSFSQEINRKDVHSSRTQQLNSYEAKKIAEDTYETLKRYTQKPDGSFAIKFLGLSAGKFENNNKNDITTFFKQINKNDAKTSMEHSCGKENKLNGNNENLKNDSKLEMSFRSNYSKETDLNKTNNKTSNNSLMKFLNTSLNKMENNYGNQYNSNTENKCFASAFNIKENQKNLGDINKEMSINKYSSTHINMEKEVHKSPLKIDINEIENDADNSIDISENIDNSADEGGFSDSTIEIDFSETLANKLEFYRKSNCDNSTLLSDEKSKDSNISEEGSPIIDTATRNRSNSFFMRYIQKFETEKSDCVDDQQKDFEEKPKNVSDVQKVKLNDMEIVSEDILTASACNSGINQELQPEIYSSDNSNSSEINCNNLPLNVILSEESNDSSKNDATDIGTTSNDSNTNLCPECNEIIPKSLFLTHMDHHMALKLMEEERKLFKEEVEIERQKRLNKSPKKTSSIKIKKQVKRKCDQPDNKITIASFFQQKSDQNNSSSSQSKTCPECSKQINFHEFSDHLDFHAAKKLHLELNSSQFTKNVSVNKKKNTLQNFFKPL